MININIPMSNDDLIPGMEKITSYLKKVQEENKRLKEENHRLQLQVQNLEHQRCTYHKRKAEATIREKAYLREMAQRKKALDSENTYDKLVISFD
jgi:regulator of replication initiation timing